MDVSRSCVRRLLGHFFLLFLFRFLETFGVRLLCCVVLCYTIRPKSIKRHVCLNKLHERQARQSETQCRSSNKPSSLSPSPSSLLNPTHHHHQRHCPPPPCSLRRLLRLRQPSPARCPHTNTRRGSAPSSGGSSAGGGVTGGWWWKRSRRAAALWRRRGWRARLQKTASPCGSAAQSSHQGQRHE